MHRKHKTSSLQGGAYVEITIAMVEIAASWGVGESDRSSDSSWACTT